MDRLMARQNLRIGNRWPLSREILASPRADRTFAEGRHRLLPGNDDAQTAWVYYRAWSAVANRLGTSLPALVLRVMRSGPITRVTCKPRGSEQELQVDVPTEVAHRLQLNLEPGTHVAITPRKARVFVPDPEYVI
jgi:hypothetical protein